MKSTAHSHAVNSDNLKLKLTNQPSFDCNDNNKQFMPSQIYTISHIVLTLTNITERVYQLDIPDITDWGFKIKQKQKKTVLRIK